MDGLTRLQRESGQSRPGEAVVEHFPLALPSLLAVAVSRCEGPEGIFGAGYSRDCGHANVRHGAL